MADNIAALKSSLRRSLIASRRNITPDARKTRSDKVMRNIIECTQYVNADLLLVYIATPIEVDTTLLIDRAFADGKAVACPVCDTRNCTMDFLIIRSYDDLSSGSYGISEPSAVNCLPALPDRSSLCIVPALACVRTGLRLGYGKGYYDRFLAGFRGMSIIACYDDYLLDDIPFGEYDRKADFIAVESGIIKT